MEEEIKKLRLGEILTKAREVKKSSIEKIAKVLRIPVPHLHALEEENFSVFSAKVYARGVFERYVHALDLEKNTMLPWFENIWKEYAGAKNHGVASALPLIHRQKNSYRPIMLGVAGISIFLLGAYAITMGVFSKTSVFFTVDEPSNDMVTHEYLITVRGKADPRVELTLNQQPVYIDKDGTYSREILLQGGINLLQFEGKNGLGKTLTVERKVVVE